MTALNHPLTWTSPRPLWRAAGQAGLQPAILRFAQDDFAEQLLGAMASEPGAIANFVARYEDWRTPPGKTATPDLADRVPLPKAIRQNRRSLLSSSAPTEVKSKEANAPLLKLYQPAHQRHYVATATLACATSGLPDRALAGSHEKVGMLMRRLMPATSDGGGPLVEYAWVPGEEARWHRVSEEEADVLAPGEELLPVFPIAHRENEKIRRKTWGGSIPVAKREDYLSAPVSREAVTLVEGQKAALFPTAPAPKPDGVKARLSEFRMDVAEPWKALLRAIAKEAIDIRADTEGVEADLQTQIRKRNYQLQMQSWLLLLDFGRFLQRHIPNVVSKLGTASTFGLTDEEINLLNWLNQPMDVSELNGVFEPTAVPYLVSLGEALAAVLGSEVEQTLETIETDYVVGLTGDDAAAWPDFHYLLAGFASDGSRTSIAIDGPFNNSTGLPDPTREDQVAGPDCPECAEADQPCPACDLLGQAAEECAAVDAITKLVEKALTPSQEETARPLPFAERLSSVMEETAGDEGLFCIRFVHLNEDCGPLHPPTLSQPTEYFRMASFFDPDAPAREIRIMLPRDTSPAGLRKHARGTAFVMSNMLCGQVQRAKGLGLIDLIRQVLPWPLHKDIEVDAGGGCKNGNGFDIGMICSLSIPIVTLCALILLMIIVTLLDFIFKWVPWLIACFPLPNFKAKEGAT
ncbi:MAG: hypothetical protein QNJ15_04635 [Erythrobacter sp.]|nr:hypothetical protein [Erythrobacter sp.]